MSIAVAHVENGKVRSRHCDGRKTSVATHVLDTHGGEKY